MQKKWYDFLPAKQALNRVREPGMPFDWSLNPYRGCAHGCSFCYARAFQRFLEREADDEFQQHISIKINAAEALEAQLAKKARKTGGNLAALARRLGPVAIGTATDPYQPVESKQRITRQCLEVLKAYRVPVSITTRSPLILRDLDILTEMPDVTVNISINTTDPQVVRNLEPASPLPGQRLQALRKLTEHGIRAGVFAAPILPCLTDSWKTLDDLFAAAKANGAAFVMTSLLRLTPDVKAWFFQILQERYPERFNTYLALYRGTCAPGEYAAAVRRRIDRLRRKYDMPAGLPATSQPPDNRQSGRRHPAAFSQAAEPVQLSLPI